MTDHLEQKINTHYIYSLFPKLVALFDISVQSYTGGGISHINCKPEANLRTFLVLFALNVTFYADYDIFVDATS